MNHLAMAIYGAKTLHECHIPEGVARNTSTPPADKKTHSKWGVEYDMCRVYVNYSRESRQTESCPLGWDYHLGPKENNIISEVRLSTEVIKMSDKIVIGFLMSVILCLT